LLLKLIDTKTYYWRICKRLVKLTPNVWSLNWSIEKTPAVRIKSYLHLSLSVSYFQHFILLQLHHSLPACQSYPSSFFLSFSLSIPLLLLLHRSSLRACVLEVLQYLCYVKGGLLSVSSMPSRTYPPSPFSVFLREAGTKLYAD